MTRKHGEAVREKIIATTIRLWTDKRKEPSAREIASASNMTHSNVFYHFTDVKGVLHEAAKQAVMENNSVIIAHLIYKGDRLVQSMGEQEKVRHLTIASNG